MRVLVVDDSVVFRSQIKAAIDGIGGMTVVGSAANGKIALERLEQMSVDIITLDLEMPEMNGLEMLAAMNKRGLKQKVIVFAAPSLTGAAQALEALRAGAADFIAKPNSAGSLDEALAGIKAELVPKILQFKARIEKRALERDLVARSAAPRQGLTPLEVRPSAASSRLASTFKPRIVGIGSSTGGPTALDIVFAFLKDQPLSIPILIAQHMPPNFTKCLAKRLGEISGHVAKEGEHGEPVNAGCIYVAPGDFHMTVAFNADKRQVQIQLDQGPKRNSVRPAVDSLFESMAVTYGSSCAVYVLTGMGEDGMIGAKAIKGASGGVMIQDQNSSVVWGMPGAVHAAGAFDAMGNLGECANSLLQMVK